MPTKKHDGDFMDSSQAGQPFYFSFVPPVFSAGMRGSCASSTSLTMQMLSLVRAFNASIIDAVSCASMDIKPTLANALFLLQCAVSALTQVARPPNSQTHVVTQTRN